jgi:hypothetical protein
MMDPKPLLARLDGLLSEALEFEQWGQSLEASEAYAKCAQILERDHGSYTGLSDPPILQNLFHVFCCLRRRSALLSSGERLSRPNKDDMRATQNLLRQTLKIGSSVSATAPIVQSLPPIASLDPTNEYKRSFYSTVVGQSGGATMSTSVGTSVTSTNSLQTSGVSSSLLPPPLPRDGMRFVTLHIEKVGLKDAMRYVDPFISYTLVNERGLPMEHQQDTPVSRKLKPLYIDFGVDLFVQTPLEQWQPGACIYLELKHYKADKNKISTRCFAVLQKSRLEGVGASTTTLPLELFKKPTDFTAQTERKPFTVKPLYMHVNVTVKRS